MLDDYIDRFYTKLAARSAHLTKDNYAKAREIVAWKEEMAAAWDKIVVEKVDIPDDIHHTKVGESLSLAVTLDVSQAGISSGIGIEFVGERQTLEGETEHIVAEMNQVQAEAGKMRFELNYRLKKAGQFQYSFRMFPKNAELPHRMDFCYVRWF